ncbi:MAG: hypothetical protein A2W90_23335 [Bacteroidetes bacterium GWF2_42_66]|nr:MAG: hypothetical protein A2W92_03145 [Bacteroidetes bacterium GWA2_42_15]OFY00365.1 MAG: hypothetical protein A2W89_14330 [Bacteroidetes bacterium GWE2_42_39]OFY47065.1 MAG: hypothetical protein A2W90_23335 [Bacteroidetes bacterium GWF2_42_66]HBL76770.1 hypothetical protein [Prolixibacteraceae bacterium]HCR89514.1 hypothetical protein [Prolixibacteraceae bacterium]
MNLEIYKTYSTDDFILDEKFREVVNNPDKKAQLNELLNKLPDKKHEIKLAIQIVQKLHAEKFKQAEKRKQELWQQIFREHQRKIRLSYLKYAASFLLLAGIGSTVLYFFIQKPAEEVIVSDILPTKDALLILADGKTVSITSKKSTIQYSPDGSGITVNDTSGVAQVNLDKGVNQLIVPYGKRSFITLSEGTKVWLNSGSKLIFPPAFKGKTREVILEGEALFDVTEDKEKPFFVKTDVFKLKVYGTKFNVQAYNQDEDYQVVLVEGKVSMNPNASLQSKEVFLTPNQKASINRGVNEFEIVTVENTDVYTAWVDGYLTFTNEEVTSLLKRVSRYYNVEMVAEFNRNVERIYGKLDMKDDLERVLDGIAFISKTSYTKQGNKYVFKNN